MCLPSKHISVPVNIYTAWATTTFSSIFPRNGLEEYFKDSRDIKKVKDPGKCEKQKDQHGKGGVKGTYIGAMGLTFPSFPQSPASSTAKAYKIRHC